MTKKHLNTMSVGDETHARLTARMKYGDSYERAIVALLDLADKYSPLPKAPEPQKPPEKGYEAPPNTAVQTFVNEVHNEQQS